MRLRVFTPPLAQLFLVNLGPAFVAELALEGVHLGPDGGEDLRRVGEQRFEFGHQLEQTLVLVLDLLLFECGQAAQLHVQNGLGLDLAQVERGDQSGAGFLDVCRSPDQRDHLVDIVDGYSQTFEDVKPRLRLPQIELRPSGNDLPPEIDEVAQSSLQRKRLGHAVDERHHVGGEGRAQRCALVELVQDHVGSGGAAEFDHYPHSLAV